MWKVFKFDKTTNYIILSNISMKRYVSLLSKNIFIILALTAIVFIFFNLQTLFEYIKTPLISGGDAPSYIGVGQYYAEHIFPSTWGWIPNWFAGMPFPQFYPPLIFILTALFSKIFFFLSYITIFKLFSLSVQILVPVSIVWLTYHATKNIYSVWFSSFLSIIFVSHDALFERFDGLTIASTLNSGFVAQSFGFILMLVWFKYFTQTKQTVHLKIISILLLFLIFISNAHIVPIVAIYFICTYLYHIFNQWNFLSIKKIMKITLSFALQGITPLLLAAFWYIPLYMYTDYFVTVALKLPDQLLKKSLYIIIFTLLSLCISFLQKQKQIFILSISNTILLFLLFIDIQKYIPNFPIQPDRWLATIFFIGLIHIAYVLGESILFLYKKTKKNFFIPIFILLIFLLIPTINKLLSFHQNMNLKNDSDFGKISEHLQNTKGRIHVENFFTGFTFTSFAYDAYLGLHTEGSNTISLRESSISSLFMVPLRNSLSQSLEVYGIKSYKALDKSLHTQNWETNIQRAIHSGTKYFLFSSPVKKYKASESELLTLEKEYSVWSLFSAKEQVSLAEIQKYKPVLLFSEINFKDRGPNEYNYTRIQEEFFFGKIRDYVLVQAHELKLDTTEDLSLFDTVVLTSYTYTNIDVAYEKLYEYSKTKDLVLVFNTDPLFTRLSSLSTKDHKIKIIPRNINNNADAVIFNKNIQSLFEYLDSIKKPLSNNFELNDSSIDQTKITVSMKGDSTMVPVLIKETYFPTWKNINGQNTYMATPTFMLTFATSSFEMNFKTPKSVYLGWIISLGTAISVGVFWFYTRKNNV